MSILLNGFRLNGNTTTLIKFTTDSNENKLLNNMQKCQHVLFASFATMGIEYVKRITVLACES